MTDNSSVKPERIEKEKEDTTDSTDTSESITALDYIKNQQKL